MNLQEKIASDKHNSYNESGSCPCDYLADSYICVQQFLIEFVGISDIQTLSSFFIMGTKVKPSQMHIYMYTQASECMVLFTNVIFIEVTC